MYLCYKPFSRQSPARMATVASFLCPPSWGRKPRSFISFIRLQYLRLWYYIYIHFHVCILYISLFCSQLLSKERILISRSLGLFAHFLCHGLLYIKNVYNTPCAHLFMYDTNTLYVCVCVWVTFTLYILTLWIFFCFEKNFLFCFVPFFSLLFFEVIFSRAHLPILMCGLHQDTLSYIICYLII